MLWTVDKRKNDDNRPEANKQDLLEYYKPKTIYQKRELMQNKINMERRNQRIHRANF